MLHHEILETRKKEDTPSGPKITKGILLTYWTESFLDYEPICVRRRGISNVYVHRPRVDVSTPVSDLLTDLPYSEENESVEEELITRAYHTHSAFRRDSSYIYVNLEEATRGT